MNQIIDVTQNNKGIKKVVHAVQNDSGRVLKLSVSDRADLTSNLTYNLVAEKPSGLSCYIPATYNATDNVVTVALTNQLMAEAGNVKAQLEITDTAGKVTAYYFYICVEEALRDDSTIESSNEFTALQSMINNVTTVKSEFDSAISAVSTSTELTDIRVKADGTTATTAGNAVREQISAINGDLVQFHDKVFVESKTNLLEYDDVEETTVNGLTYSIVNGVYSISGTSTSATTIQIPIKNAIPSGNYKYNNFISYTSASGIQGSVSLKTSGNQYIALPNGTTPNAAITITNDTPTHINLYYGNGKSPNITYHFCVTSENQSTYPYDSIEIADTLNRLIVDTYGIGEVDKTRVVCWGDSLTDGTGASNPNTNSYPILLGNILTENGNNLTVENAGIGGEDTFAIGFRNGAVELKVKPCTIPSSGSVDVEIDKWNRRDVTILKRGGTNVTWNVSKLKLNPVVIGGIKGDLLRDSSGNIKFTRAESGTSKTFNRPERIIVNAVENYNLNTDMSVIWAGTNNVNDDIETVVDSIKMIIDNLKNDKYIVVGLTDKHLYSDLLERNEKYAIAFGKHFLNIHDYLVDYGLSDANITPSAQDQTDIANEDIPSSLRSDTTHFNDNGYPIVAQQVYKKGVELGYWD